MTTAINVRSETPGDSHLDLLHGKSPYTGDPLLCDSSSEGYILVDDSGLLSEEYASTFDSKHGGGNSRSHVVVTPGAMV